MKTSSTTVLGALLAWVLISTHSGIVPVQAQSWNLPAELNDTNTKVGFQVDSTWHLIHGTTKNLSGRAWLENESDPTSVRARVIFPVRAFDTDNSSRDSRMREVLQADKHGEVLLELLSLGEGCSPTALEALPECSVKGHAKLSIRGITHELDLPLRVKHAGDGYEISGKAKIQWPDFGVEDPSILVARLAKEVEIHYTVSLAKTAK